METEPIKKSSVKDYYKEYYKKHKAEILEKNKKYIMKKFEADPTLTYYGLHKDYIKKYQEKNREKIKEYKRAYYARKKLEKEFEGLVKKMEDDKKR